MITEAIDKITKEVNTIKGDNVQAIGEYLIDTITEESAARIMDEKKTLSGCMAHITSQAKARATNNMAMIRDTEVYSWVRKYYGISEAGQSILPSSGQMNVSLLDLI